MLGEKDVTSSGTTRTDYFGNVIYNNMAPTLLLTDNGYVTLSDNKYHFYYKDHEGNNRVVADQSNTVYIDPSCEKYYDVSPYVYCYDEPIKKIDIEGKDS